MKRMKQCITFSLVCCIISIQLTAQTSLTVFSDNSPFTLYVNGEQKNAAPATSVKATGIAGTQCSVRLTFQNSGTPELKQHVYLEGADNLIFEVKKNKKGNPVLRLLSSDEVSQMEAITEKEVPTKKTGGLTEEDREAIKVVTTTTAAGISSYPQPVQPNNSGPAKVVDQGPIMEPEQKPVAAKNPYERYRTAKGFCNSPNLTADNIMKLKVKMEEKSKDERWRASYLKEILEPYLSTPGKCVTCKQYADLMNRYLVSDIYKYNVAKALFMKVYDPGNYDLIRETLKDNSYKQKLDEITLGYLSGVYGE